MLLFTSKYLFPSSILFVILNRSLFLHSRLVILIQFKQMFLTHFKQLTLIYFKKNYFNQLFLVQSKQLLLAINKHNHCYKSNLLETVQIDFNILKTKIFLFFFNIFSLVYISVWFSVFTRISCVRNKILNIRYCNRIFAVSLNLNNIIVKCTYISIKCSRKYLMYDRLEIGLQSLIAASIEN